MMVFSPHFVGLWKVGAAPGIPDALVGGPRVLLAPQEWHRLPGDGGAAGQALSNLGSTDPAPSSRRGEANSLLSPRSGAGRDGCPITIAEHLVQSLPQNRSFPSSISKETALEGGSVSAGPDRCKEGSLSQAGSSAASGWEPVTHPGARFWDKASVPGRTQGVSPTKHPKAHVGAAPASPPARKNPPALCRRGW